MGKILITIKSLIEIELLVKEGIPPVIKIGFIARTPRGRVATPAAFKYFGVPYSGDYPTNINDNDLSVSDDYEPMADKLSSTLGDEDADG